MALVVSVTNEVGDRLVDEILGAEVLNGGADRAFPHDVGLGLESLDVGIV